MDKTLKVYGEHGKRVRVHVHESANGNRLIRVRWREGGKRKTESWHDTRENREKAHAYAKGVAARLEHRVVAAPKPITLWELYDRYVEHHEKHWRTSTRRNAAARWKKFQAFAGMSRAAHTVTMEMLDQFRTEMRKPDAARGGKPHAVNQVAAHVKVVKAVFRFARLRKLIPDNPLSDYVVKLPKDERRMEIPEYTPQEARALLAKCDPRDSRLWRLYVALHVFAFAGPRQNAARHLEWDDVDFGAGTVRWRPEYDKLGYDRTQLLPVQVIDALWVAYGWRTAYGYDGPYIFFRPGAGTIDRGGWHTARKGPTKRSLARASAKPDKPWTYQAFNGALRRLEDAVGIEHVQHRAAHGFRRYVVTEIHAATGNLALAGQYVGDKDIRTLSRSYLRERPEEMRRAVDHMERTSVPEATPKGERQKATKKQRPADEGEPNGVEA